MSNAYDKPVRIQKIDEETELWKDVYSRHAKINKAKSDNEYLSAGAVQAKRSLVFDVRYFKELENIAVNLQSYRIMYQNVPYDIVDYDDFELKHNTVKLLGVSY